MTQQAELYKKIDKLPPKYFGQVIDFVGYLEHIESQSNGKGANVANSSVRRRSTPEEEIAYINLHADRLNKEAMDNLSYQWPGFNEEKLREMEMVNRQAAEINNGVYN